MPRPDASQPSIGSAKEVFERLRNYSSQADQEKMIAIFFFDFTCSR